MFKKMSKKGFSLVELLVVITIIAILSVVAYTAFGGQTVKARDTKRKQDLATIQQALEVYYAENQKYPTSLTSGTDISAGLIPKKYLSTIPKDPGLAGNSYAYATIGTTFELGATLEGDGVPANFKAYVVGNSDTPLLKGPGNCSVTNDQGACLPYNP